MNLKVIATILLALFITPVVYAIEPKEEAVVEFGDLKIFYRTYGEGEPLLLLHGYGSSGEENWGPFLEELASEFTLIVPDLRGHGRSNNPEEEFTHRTAADDMLKLLDHFKVDRVKAMGISTGGMTLLHMATKDHDRIDAMVLIGATHYFPEEARVDMRRVKGEDFIASNPYWRDERMMKIHKRGREQVDKLRRNFHAFKDSYEDMNFTRPLLSTIVARTFIVHGDRDQLFPVEIPVEMYNSIPNATLWIVPEIGHVPLFKPGGIGVVDESFPFIPKMAAFLRRQD